MKKHGDELGYLEARRIYGGNEDATSFFTGDEGSTHEERKLADEQDFSGTVGKGLFSEKQAVYVPSLTCVVCFQSSEISKSQFVLHACYTSESPLMMENALWARKFHWSCEILQYFCMLSICFSENHGKLSLAIWLLLAIIEGLASSAERTEEASRNSDHSKKDLFDRRGYWLLAKRLFRKKKYPQVLSKEHLENIEENICVANAAQIIQRRARGHLTRVETKRRLDLLASGEAWDGGAASDSSGYSSDAPSDDYSKDSFDADDDHDSFLRKHWAAGAIQRRIRGVLGRKKSPYERKVAAHKVRHNHWHHYQHQHNGQQHGEASPAKPPHPSPDNATVRAAEVASPKVDVEEAEEEQVGTRSRCLSCARCRTDGAERDPFYGADDDVYGAHITGTMDERELKRVLLTGPGKARDLLQAAISLSERVMRNEFTPEECLKLLRWHASNIHEARWRIDELRSDLNTRYAKRLRRKAHERFMKCLMQGPVGVVEGEIGDDAAEANSQAGKNILLNAMGVRFTSWRDVPVKKKVASTSSHEHHPGEQHHHHHHHRPHSEHHQDPEHQRQHQHHTHEGDEGAQTQG